MTNPLAEFKHAAIVNILKNCALFSGPPHPDLDRIANITVMKSVAKGDYLFHESHAAHGFYILFQGAIKVSRVNSLGREQVIHIFRPTESFAEETLVTDLGYPADASAVEPSKVLMVQKSGFIALLKQQPELALVMLRSMNQHLNLLVELLDDLTLKDVKTRLVNWLLQHCPNPESHEAHSIHLTMTKRLLASELGTTSETFSRTLAKLRDLKLLSIAGKTVVLLCPIKLAQFLRGNLGLPSARFSGQYWSDPAWGKARPSSGTLAERIEGLGARSRLPTMSY